MPLFVPSSQDFKFSVSNVDGTRPAAAFGQTITPGNNSYGSYAEVLSDTVITEDCYAILINFNSNAVAASARDTLVTIGKDPAGGTSYTDWLTHLLATNAAPYNVGSGGVWYYFPIFIKAGTALAAKATVNNATVGTLRCIIKVFGRPRAPESLRYGTRFRSFGEVTASSRGTTVTPGTTSEGAWTQLGSAIDVPLWWWQIGWGVNDASTQAAVVHADISRGDATNKIVMAEDVPICLSTSEQINNSPLTAGCVANAPANDNVYGRAQSSGAADTNCSMIAYGVG